MSTSVLVVVWDGCRPDWIDPDVTPYLAALAARGVTCRDSRVAYPSMTRVSSASFITGSYPDRHHLSGNELYIPAIDAATPISLGERESLLAIARLQGGRLFAIPTLGDVLAANGRRAALVSTATPGSATIVGTGLDCTIGRTFALPEPVATEVGRRFGPPPAYPATEALNDYAARVAVEYVLSELAPDVLIMWLCEPDTSLHRHGIGSPEVRRALAHNDRLLQRVCAALPAEAHVIVLSDHGHSRQAAGEIRIAEVLQDALAATLGADFVVASDGVTFTAQPERELLAKAVRALQRCPEIGPIFTELPLPGTLPHSSVRLAGPYTPHIKYSWQHRAATPPDDGFTFTSRGSRSRSSHGSFHPADMHNMLFAAGPRFAAGKRSDLPCGLVDVAPSVLSLFAIEPPAEWDGRVLHELYDPSPATNPAQIDVTTECRRSEVRWGPHSYSQELHRRWVGSTCYLDRVHVLHDAPPG